MHYSFGTPGIITIAIVFLLCLFFFYYSSRKIRSRIGTETDLVHNKYGNLKILFGLVISILSVLLHLYYANRISRSPRFLHMVSEMTLEPVIVFSIVFFLIGSTLLLVGIDAARFRKKILKKSP